MAARRRFPGDADARRKAGSRALDDTRAADHARTLDERYGLEPLFEPGDDRDSVDDPAGSGTESYTVECPYCGEPFETLLDLSAGSASYIEDCRVCCQPIEFEVRTDAVGHLSKVSVRRGD
jgi:Cysteine-rich CPXCG